jgi:hypothetical protein
VWASCLQTDILALTHALADCGAVELQVATSRPRTFREQLIQRVKPLNVPLLDIEHWATLCRVRRFQPELIITDGQLPEIPLASRLLYMWHGLGMWKVKPREEIADFAMQAHPHAGDITRPTARFLAHGYGDTTCSWLTAGWGIAPENCRPMGMPFSDWILSPPYDRRQARKAIGLGDALGPTVALSLTWHYGARMDAWGRLNDLAAAVLERIRRHRGRLLLCLHDCGFFDDSIVDELSRFAARHDDVYLRPRNLYPDNLADLLAADVMVSNYSSFLGYFYVTGRPSIHLDPRRADGTHPRIASYATGYRKLHQVDRHDVHLNPLENHGGLAVRGYDELSAALDRALADPGCCQVRSERFLGDHVAAMDGRTSRRMVNEILRWLGDLQEPGVTR